MLWGSRLHVCMRTPCPCMTHNRTSHDCSSFTNGLIRLLASRSCRGYCQLAVTWHLIISTLQLSVWGRLRAHQWAGAAKHIATQGAEPAQLHSQQCLVNASAGKLVAVPEASDHRILPLRPAFRPGCRPTLELKLAVVPPGILMTGTWEC